MFLVNLGDYIQNLFLIIVFVSMALSVICNHNYDYDNETKWVFVAGISFSTFIVSLFAEYLVKDMNSEVKSMVAFVSAIFTFLLASFAFYRLYTFTSGKEYAEFLKLKESKNSDDLIWPYFLDENKLKTIVEHVDKVRKEKPNFELLCFDFNSGELDLEVFISKHERYFFCFSCKPQWVCNISFNSKNDEVVVKKANVLIDNLDEVSFYIHNTAVLYEERYRKYCEYKKWEEEEKEDDDYVIHL